MTVGVKRLLFLIPVIGFCQPPDGGFAVNLSASQTTTVPFNNQSLSCTAWQITYTATGLTSLSLLAQQAPAGPIPSGFTTYAGIVQQGSNPNTSTVGAVTWLQNGTTVVPWFQLSASGLNGGGTITGTVYCWRSNAGPPIINPGSGTVTNFSSGNFTPLFTTLVTSSTLTPNLTFSPISQSPGLFFASPASASGNPIFRAIVASDIPTLNQNTTGQSGTTLAFASSPSLCISGQAPRGVDINGNATGCTAVGPGTVTSVSSGNFSPLFNVSVATGTTTPAISFAAISQLQNLVFASPNGSSGNGGFRTLVGADLPNPSASTLGGIQSIAAVTHKWINTISTSGIPSATQPACGDLSDAVATCNTLTAHTLSAPLDCAAASASGTAYTCSTSTTFVPAAGDSIYFKSDVANTGSATLNVNSSSTATIKKQGGGTNLVANDLLASQWTLLTFDGTNWQVQGQIGNAASGGGSSRGIFASAPPCATSGNTYYSTDVDLLGQCNGSSYQWYYRGHAITLPSLTTFTGQNMAGGNGASISTNGVMTMTIPIQAGGVQIHGQNITLPATPYTVDAWFLVNAVQNNYTIASLYVTDGTKLVAFTTAYPGSPSPFLQVLHYTTVTGTATSDIAAQNWQGGANLFGLRWHDDGTNFTFFFSVDGFTWTQFGGNLSRTAFLTPTQIGWYGDVEQTQVGAAITLVHWLVH